jgi:hypothetical protein
MHYNSLILLGNVPFTIKKSDAAIGLVLKSYITYYRLVYSICTFYLIKNI